MMYRWSCNTCEAVFPDDPGTVCPVCRSARRKARRQGRNGVNPPQVPGFALAWWEHAYENRRAKRRFRIALARRQAIYRRDGYRCLECGSKKNLTLDHHIPRSKGGGDESSNLRTLCATCNVAKGSTMPKGLVVPEAA